MEFINCVDVNIFYTHCYWYHIYTLYSDKSLSCPFENYFLSISSSVSFLDIDCLLNLF